MTPKSLPKRPLDLLVLSDIHLGTYGCRAKELLRYLKSVDPEQVVLNGDIIDMWQFRKRYFPKSHMKVVKHFMGWLSKGKTVHYVTGNHDEMLRKFEGFQMGSLKIVNKLVLELDGKKAWVFHGDVFDVTMKHAKWLTKLGAISYDLLILLNGGINAVAKAMGRERVSLSKKIKNSVKSAVKYINNFEEAAANVAIAKGYDYIVCGHIHQPAHRTIEGKEGSVVYLNSGDWIENLTALEYAGGTWRVYEHERDMRVPFESVLSDEEPLKSSKELFGDLVQQFAMASR